MTLSENKGYEGKYTIVKDYCKSLKVEKQKAGTIRFETTSGLHAQVGWKESIEKSKDILYKKLS
jgi:transposase